MRINDPEIVEPSPPTFYCSQSNPHHGIELLLDPAPLASDFTASCFEMPLTFRRLEGFANKEFVRREGQPEVAMIAHSRQKEKSKELIPNIEKMCFSFAHRSSRFI